MPTITQIQMKIFDFRQSLRQTIERFLPEEADIVSDILLAEALDTDRTKLLTLLDQEITPRQAERVATWVKRLAYGEPIQYILEHCYFYGHRIEVGSGCFIPRSDTEVLVDIAVSIIGDNHFSFADICAGSGCVSLAIAESCKNSYGYALELSRKAIEYAELNLKDTQNVSIRRFDALDDEDYLSLSGQISRKLDIIVSNPPYIPNEDIHNLDQNLHYEPETALDGGYDGLRFYREIITNAPLILKDEGVILFEVGIGQAESVSELLENAGYSVAVFKDYGDIDRVVLGKKD